MKTLTCYITMGLVRQHGGEVWKTVGTFASEEAALSAARDRSLLEKDIVKTRVMPYYRERNDAGRRAAATVVRRPNVKFSQTVSPVAVGA